MLDPDPDEMNAGPQPWFLNWYFWSSLDERGAQSAPVCHSGQASHREQRTAPGDEDINYLWFIKLPQKLMAALVFINVDKLITAIKERVTDQL